MKAAQLLGPETIELVEMPIPACPEDGVLLQVRACGVCGSDLRRWKEGPAPGGVTVPGHEFAGELVEVGASVNDYAVGDHLERGRRVFPRSCHRPRLRRLVRSRKNRGCPQ